MATALFKPYGRSAANMAKKAISLDSTTDTVKLTLHTSSYSPNLDTHEFVSDLSNELAASGGYSTGGVTLTSKVVSYVAANSWAQSAATSTAYVVGDVRRPSTGNGFLYRCVVAGTSGSSAPSWSTTIGRETTDGTAVWCNVGSGAMKFDADDVSWATATFTGVRYAVLSDRQTGTAATEPLIAVADFGSDQAGAGGTFTVQMDVTGVLLGFKMA